MIRMYELRVLRVISGLTVNGKAPDYAAIAALLGEENQRKGGWLRKWMPLWKPRLETALANLEDEKCLKKAEPPGLGRTREEARRGRTFRVTDIGFVVLKNNP